MVIITFKLKNIAVSLFGVALLICLFIYGKDVNKVVFETLVFCFSKLIPSLFPFMAFAGILVKNGKNNSQKHGFFRLCFISWLCGYIIGPKILQDENYSDITEYIALTSNAGIGFVVSYVGGIIWGNLAFGAILYIFQILSSFVIFLIFKRKKTFDLKFKKLPLISAVNSSVSDSTYSVITICGFTVFFSLIRYIICEIFSFGEIGNQVISSTLEISNGILFSTTLSSNILCGFFTGFALGFGGICMCMQTFAVCKDECICKKKFILIKFIHGIICGTFSAIFVYFTDVKPTKETVTKIGADLEIYKVFVCTLFVFLALSMLKRLLKKQII